jgi:hypothetical protein
LVDDDDSMPKEPSLTRFGLVKRIRAPVFTNPKRDNRLQGVLKGVFKKGVHVQTESCEFL